MDARSYFNFPDAGPEPEVFPTFEQWCWKWVHEECVAMERLVHESIRESAAVKNAPPVPTGPVVPPIPDAVPVNESVRGAWHAFHSVSRTLCELSVPASARRVPRRRPMRTLVGDPDLRHLLP